jgi:predicted transcriptional regulator
MRVLLSIKPEFADKIFSGEKKYEFRKVIFKRPNIKTVVVYASSPTKKVIGEFEVEEILSQNIASLWNITRQEAGITEEYYLSYFANRTIAHAIKIASVRKYNLPLDLNKVIRTPPPQSYVYL